MTLRDFFESCGDNPFLIIAFFALIPFTAFLAGILGKNEGHLSPWKYLYSILIYLVCVPGIFAITLNLYIFLFERQISILDMNLVTQILPIASMILTILIIRRNVNLDYVPGFDKIGGLIMMITAILMIMWAFDRTRIWVVSRLPIGWAALIFIGLLAAVRIGWSRLAGKSVPVSQAEEGEDWYQTEK